MGENEYYPDAGALCKATGASTGENSPGAIGRTCNTENGSGPMDFVVRRTMAKGFLHSTKNEYGQRRLSRGGFRERKEKATGTAGGSSGKNKFTTSPFFRRHESERLGSDDMETHRPSPETVWVIGSAEINNFRMLRYQIQTHIRVPLSLSLFYRFYTIPSVLSPELKDALNAVSTF